MQIITRANRSLTLDLVDREESTGSNRARKHGKLTVHAEECISSKTTTEIIFRCSDLESKDLFSRSVWAETCWFLYIFLGVTRNLSFASLSVLTYHAGPLFGNIKSCGEWDPNSSLQNGSDKGWPQADLEASIFEYSTGWKQGIRDFTFNS